MLFLILLEKAVAKLLGGYEKLDDSLNENVNTSLFLSIITGA